MLNSIGGPRQRSKTPDVVLNRAFRAVEKDLSLTIAKEHSQSEGELSYDELSPRSSIISVSSQKKQQHQHQPQQQKQSLYEEKKPFRSSSPSYISTNTVIPQTNASKIINVMDTSTTGFVELDRETATYDGFLQDTLERSKDNPFNYTTASIHTTKTTASAIYPIARIQLDVQTTPRRLTSPKVISSGCFTCGGQGMRVGNFDDNQHHRRKLSSSEEFTTTSTRQRKMRKGSLSSPPLHATLSATMPFIVSQHPQRSSRRPAIGRRVTEDEIIQFRDSAPISTTSSTTSSIRNAEVIPDASFSPRPRHHSSPPARTSVFSTSSSSSITTTHVHSEAAVPQESSVSSYEKIRDSWMKSSKKLELSLSKSLVSLIQSELDQDMEARFENLVASEAECSAFLTKNVCRFESGTTLEQKYRAAVSLYLFFQRASLLESNRVVSPSDSSNF